MTELENNQWFATYCIVVYGRQKHDSKYGTNRVLFASTYTAKETDANNNYSQSYNFMIGNVYFCHNVQCKIITDIS